jgi:hypothetical protein
VAKAIGGAAARPVQLVNGYEFPTGPGPARRRFRSEREKWAEIVATLVSVRGLLSTSDRGFYRALIGVEAMALQNLRDRTGPTLLELEEPELSWLGDGSGL